MIYYDRVNGMVHFTEKGITNGWEGNKSGQQFVQNCIMEGMNYEREKAKLILYTNNFSKCYRHDANGKTSREGAR